MSGPYAWTRNPLYFGSFLLVVGFAVASHSWFAAGLIVGYYAIFYPAVMRREEVELRRKHGQAFEEYAAQVPLFFPRAPRRAGGGRATFLLGSVWAQSGVSGGARIYGGGDAVGGADVGGWGGIGIRRTSPRLSQKPHVNTTCGHLKGQSGAQLAPGIF